MKSVGICRIFNNFATEYIYEEKATAAFVSLSNRNSKDMSKASWLPAHDSYNGDVGFWQYQQYRSGDGSCFGKRPLIYSVVDGLSKFPWKRCGK